LQAQASFGDGEFSGLGGDIDGGRMNIMQPNFEIMNQQMIGEEKKSKARLKELQRHVDLNSGMGAIMNSSNYQSAKKVPNHGGLLDETRERYDQMRQQIGTQ
jgi:hypothetical protein